jgi:hypothetical protein
MNPGGGQQRIRCAQPPRREALYNSISAVLVKHEEGQPFEAEMHTARLIKTSGLKAPHDVHSKGRCLLYKVHRREVDDKMIQRRL